MPTPLSNGVDNLYGRIFNSIECKKCMERKIINSECCFDKIKNGRLVYRCRECKEEWLRPVNEIIKKFSSTYQFCNGDLNKFVLLLRKSVYSYVYMDSWEKFNETSLPDKNAFYSKLNEEDITDEDYLHAQKVWKVFEIKKLGEYHDLYVQSDTLDVFENLQMCLKTLETNALIFMNLILLIFCLYQD